jgi:hypothetical protein
MTDAITDPNVVAAIETLLHAVEPVVQEAGAATEAASPTLAQEVVPVVNSLASMASAAAPVVTAIAPEVGVGISVGVAVLNSIEALNGWLAMVPDGVAKQGIQAEMVNIKQIVNLS